MPDATLAVRIIKVKLVYNTQVIISQPLCGYMYAESILELRIDHVGCLKVLATSGKLSGLQPLGLGNGDLVIVFTATRKNFAHHCMG